MSDGTQRFLAAEGFKDVVCEVLRETPTGIVIQWWNVSPAFSEPFPMAKNSVTLAMETISRHKFRSGEWASFETLDEAKSYVLRGRVK